MQASTSSRVRGARKPEVDDGSPDRDLSLGVPAFPANELGVEAAPPVGECDEDSSERDIEAGVVVEKAAEDAETPILVAGDLVGWD